MRLDPERWRELQEGNDRLALLGSAMFFGAMHSEIWPTPVPLFFLGLALGWVYWRGRSLLSTIVLHALFNAVAFLSLLWPELALRVN